MDNQYIIKERSPKESSYYPYEEYYSYINYEAGKGWYMYKDYKICFLGHDIGEALNNLKDKIERKII